MDLTGFNPQQKEAVTLPTKVTDLSDVLIVAGAGSGKTRVLIHRVAYLVENGVPGENILALTFTKKAANEMVSRLKDMSNYSPKTKMSTFHSLAVDILKEFSGKSFEIIDENDKSKIIKSILKRETFETDIALKSFLGWLSYTRNLCISPYKIELDDDVTIRDYKKIASIYRDDKQKIGNGGVFDFDDLLEKAVILLSQKSGVCRLLHRRWSHILVDEYQDTNKIQYRFLSLIRGVNTQLLQVGDEDQLIYSWRGADINHILDSYKKSISSDSVHCVLLNTNYRCSGNILELANNVIACNKERTGKSLVAHKDSGEMVKIKEYYNSYEESKDVVKSIKKWKADGINFSDMVILIRTNMLSRPIERALIQGKVPYYLHNSTAMFDTKEIRLLISLLKLTENPNEVFYFEGIMDVVKFGIGEVALNKMKASIKDSEVSVIEYLELHPAHSSNERVKQLIRLMKKAKEFVAGGQLKEAANYWLVEWDLMSFFKKEEQEKKMDVCLLFLGVLDDYEQDCIVDMSTPSVSNFQEQRLIDDAIVKTGETDAVQIMTIHKSKGLEFDNGFIIGMQDGAFPVQLEKDGCIAEEDVRLAYVAITRFKNQLIITKSVERIGFNKLSIYSSLIDDLPEELTDTVITYN